MKKKVKTLIILNMLFMLSLGFISHSSLAQEASNKELVPENYEEIIQKEIQNKPQSTSDSEKVKKIKPALTKVDINFASLAQKHSREIVLFLFLILAITLIASNKNKNSKTEKETKQTSEAKKSSPSKKTTTITVEDAVNNFFNLNK